MRLKTFNGIVNRIVTANSPIKIILFGSHARGDARKDSDLDLLIIEDHFKNKGMEMAKARLAIGNTGMGVDVLVYSQEEVNEWGNVPGSVLYAALKEGKTLYEATG